MTITRRFVKTGGGGGGGGGGGRAAEGSGGGGGGGGGGAGDKVESGFPPSVSAPSLPFFPNTWFLEDAVFLSKNSIRLLISLSF